MASIHVLLSIAIAAFVASPAIAMDYVVGDEKGWTIGFDYQAWAQGKEFRVGDELIFKYPEGAHNVHKVDGTAFQQCVPPAMSEALSTGNDVITLATTGRKWYICGVGKHCEVGKQKLVINVMPQLGSPAPSPASSGPSLAPTSAAIGISKSNYFSWMIAAFGTFMMILA